MATKVATVPKRARVPLGKATVLTTRHVVVQHSHVVTNSAGMERILVNGRSWDMEDLVKWCNFEGAMLDTSPARICTR